jgi:hypothetical protein
VRHVRVREVADGLNQGLGLCAHEASYTAPGLLSQVCCYPLEDREISLTILAGAIITAFLATLYLAYRSHERSEGWNWRP